MFLWSAVVTFLWLILWSWSVYSIPEAEFQALKDLFIATDGPNWESPWDFTDLNASNYCENRFAETGCNDTIDSINVLFINGNNLGGTIPESLGSLTNLQYLWIWNNVNLYGTLPDTIFTQMPSMTSLWLNNVGLYGKISDKISNWHELQAVTIQYTNLNGTLPHSMYGLPNLYSVSITNNQYLNIYINDDICNLTNLQTLQFTDNNYVFGTFPGDCIRNFQSLSTLQLDASNNDIYDDNMVLRGTITEEFTSLTSLYQLSIRNTKVNGTILGFNNYSRLASIAYLDLYNNEFSGTISSALCDSSVLVKPWQVGWIYFHYFDISYNLFNGEIPDCLSYRIFSIYNRNPYFYGYITSIVILSNNYLTGNIGFNNNDKYSTYNSTCRGLFGTNVNNTCFGKLAFDASNNNFDGTISEQLTYVPMYYFFVSNNKLNGDLPHGWDVQMLDVSFNELNGKIEDNLIDPAAFGETNMVILASNNFQGGIPSGVINLYNLAWFSAQNNDFDELPSNVSNPALKGIYLHNNNIKQDNIGEYLNELIEINPNLEEISLHHNNGIRGNLNKLKININNNSLQLKRLWLDNCNIYGKLSSSMFTNYDENSNTAPHLEFFTVHNNHLSCKLPTNYIINNPNMSLVVPGNLFTKDKSIEWINDDFDSDAAILTMTTADNTIQIVEFCIIVLFFVALISFKFLSVSKIRSKCTCNVVCTCMSTCVNYLYNLFYGENNDENSAANNQNFILTMKRIYLLFSHWFMILLYICLTIIYYIYSDYYQCGRFLSHFTLVYFDLNNDDNDTYGANLTSIIFSAIIMFAINCYILVNLVDLQNVHCANNIPNNIPNNDPNNDQNNDPNNGPNNDGSNKDCVDLPNSQRNDSKTSTTGIAGIAGIEDSPNNDENDHLSIAEQEKSKLRINSLHESKAQDSADNVTQVSVDDDVAGTCHTTGNDSIGNTNNTDDTGDTDDSYEISDFLQLFGYFLVWIFFVFLIIFTIILDYIPDDNIFGINSVFLRRLLRYCLVFILIANDSFVIPSLADKIIEFRNEFCLKNICSSKYNITDVDKKESLESQWRIYLICSFRSVSSILVPFIVSICLLNNCMKQWTNFWNECVNNSDSFNYSAKDVLYLNLGFSYPITVETEIMTHEQVCDFDNNDFSIGSCLREFFDFWIPIITLKTILTIIIMNPLVAHAIALLKFKMMSYLDASNIVCCEYCKNKLSEQVNKLADVDTDGRVIQVDSQYASLVTNMEFCIIFGIIAPYLLVLLSTIMFINVFTFVILIDELDFKVDNEKYNHFPIYYVFAACIVEQIFVVIICWHLFGQQFLWIVICLLCLLVVLDVVWVVVVKIPDCKLKFNELRNGICQCFVR